MSDNGDSRPLADCGLPSMEELERLSQPEQISMPIGGRLVSVPATPNGRIGDERRS